jgi:hypothetical protein
MMYLMPPWGTRLGRLASSLITKQHVASSVEGSREDINVQVEELGYKVAFAACGRAISTRRIRTLSESQPA